MRACWDNVETLMHNSTFKKILCETMLTGNHIHIKHQEETTCLQAFAGSRYNDGQTALDDSLFSALLVSSNEHYDISFWNCIAFVADDG